MTSLATAERNRLCDLALVAGPDAPTLCGDWTVRDLLAHLVVRESHPASVGILVKPAERLLESAQARVAREDFRSLVERVRSGPPVWSPFAVPVLGGLANIAEYTVHHEDVRRAQDSWVPRHLSQGEQDVLWRLVRTVGRGLGARSPVGVVAERADVAGARTRVRRRPGSAGDVVVRGTPLEVLLVLYGRQDHSVAAYDGDPADVARLTGADLGI
ncbi:TIGR03085 family metal-binding protein [Nocardioides marmoribigeumensis]|uniref:Uncharacterized protein (TIGR03085 family) n=1 Tax=Nocardioides marmoribigeumensis TaxID=433649 RepID=A0ABU2BRL0_9ACTN|nr:TIGR03085 family metal-binding protein [Nocardioides marmoribigeumensis]MDR7361248.1 uncharacterized protein (TIGR03085 family) [Nocardioides marmoribigeumensis]